VNHVSCKNSKGPVSSRFASLCFQPLPAFQKPRGLHSRPNAEIRTFTRVILTFRKSLLLTDETLGTRQAFLPGGHRTGAPGKHVVRGKAKYRLCDEKVRFFVAPPIEDIRNSPVRPTCVDPGSHTDRRLLWLASPIRRPRGSTYC
jgi:hypothetical protein